MNKTQQNTRKTIDAKLSGRAEAQLSIKATTDNFEA